MSLNINELDIKKYRSIILTLLITLLVVATAYNFKLLIIMFFIIAMAYFFIVPKDYVYLIILIWPFTFMHGYFNIYLKLMGVLLLAILIVKNKSKVIFSKFHIGLLTFISIGAISYVISIFYSKTASNITGYKQILGFSSIGIQNIFHYIYVITLSLLILNLFREKKDIFNAIRLFVKVGIVSCIIGIVLYVLYYNHININLPNLIRQFNNNQIGVWDNRLAGVAYEPLGFGNQVGVLVPITICLLIIESKKRTQYAVYLFIELITLVLTFSSGAWISTIGSCLVLIIILFTFNRRKLANKRTLLSLTVSLLLIASIVLGILNFTGNMNYVRFVLRDKFQQSQSLNDRKAMNSILIKTFEEYPILGVGIGRYIFYIDKYAPLSSEQFKFIPRPIPSGWRANNDYLTILAETGIIGTIAFLYLIFILAKQSFLFIFKNRIEGILVLGMLFSVIIVLIQMFAAFLIFSHYLWIIIGMILSTINISRLGENK